MEKQNIELTKEERLEEVTTIEQEQEVDEGDKWLEEHTDQLPQITPEEDDDDFDFNLENMEVLEASPRKNVFGEEGVLTVVNSAQNGNKRLMLSDKVYKELGSPSSVKVGFLSNTFAIGEHLPNGLPITYEFRGKGGKNSKRIIYNSDLVLKLTEKYNLDYSNGRVSVTFKKVKYKEINGNKVAFIKMM